MSRTAILIALGLAIGLAGCSRGPQSDAAITRQIKQDLAKQEFPDTVIVTTDSGVVTLGGVVTDASSRHQAEVAAANVKGVHQVINNLRTTMAGDVPARPRMAPNPPAGAPGVQPPAENMPQNPPSGMPVNPPSGQAPQNPPIPDTR